MTQKQFNNFDLREQLTDTLKNTWYYQERKHGLRINKHSVVFDNYFKFILRYHPTTYYQQDESFTYNNETYEIKKGEIEEESYIDIINENGNRAELYFEDNYYSDETKYANNPKYILEHILLYIANCI